MPIVAFLEFGISICLNVFLLILHIQRICPLSGKRADSRLSVYTTGAHETY